MLSVYRKNVRYMQYALILLYHIVCTVSVCVVMGTPALWVGLEHAMLLIAELEMSKISLCELGERER